VVVAGLEVLFDNVNYTISLSPFTLTAEMRPLPVATVATQTDACSIDGSYWDLLSLTSLVANDDDDVDSMVGYVVVIFTFLLILDGVSSFHATGL